MNNPKPPENQVSFIRAGPKAGRKLSVPAGIYSADHPEIVKRPMIDCTFLSLFSLKYRTESYRGEKIRPKKIIII